MSSPKAWAGCFCWTSLDRCKSDFMNDGNDRFLGLLEPGRSQAQPTGPAFSWTVKSNPLLQAPSANLVRTPAHLLLCAMSFPRALPIGSWRQ